jgi:transposase
MKEAIVTKLGIIPIAYKFIKELEIATVFESFLESGKEEISHGQVVSVLLLNLLDGSSPLYKLSDWLSTYSDGLGEFAAEANRYNDKRLGATLDAIYASNRHELLTELSARAIATHNLKTDIIHNDTTTVTFTGVYERNQAAGSEVELRHGYNKDHRPDYKQIVFGLNVSADGYVPVLAQLYSGNKSDDKTHQANWQALREFLGKTDFIYIADSKLSSTENLVMIDGASGKFISVLPATRSEVKDFYKELKQLDKPAQEGLTGSAGQVPPEKWKLAYEVENSRKPGSNIIYRIKQGEDTKEGFRLLWIWNSAKALQDADRRERAIAKVALQLQDILPKLNKYRLKTREQIEAYLKKHLGQGKQFFDIQLEAQSQTVKKQIGKGRPGPNTQWEEVPLTTYQLNYSLRQAAIEADAKTDGVFPLVTNTELEATQVLRHYKNQPYLEKRFNALKSVLEVAPVFLKKPERIEAMLLLYIIALMLVALIERRIRKNMEKQKVEALPILPQGMKTKKPTWSNIQFCLNSVIMLSMLFDEGEAMQHIVKGLGNQQLQVLDLLQVPVEKYHSMTPIWWKGISIRGQ